MGVCVCVGVAESSTENLAIYISIDRSEPLLLLFAAAVVVVVVVVVAVVDDDTKGGGVRRGFLPG